MSDFDLPDGVALHIETEIGFCSPDGVAELLKEATNLPGVDDLDATILLQTASSVSAMQQVMDHAIKLLNVVAGNTGQNTRIQVSQLSMALTMVTPSFEDVEVEEDV